MCYENELQYSSVRSQHPSQGISQSATNNFNYNQQTASAAQTGGFHSEIEQALLTAKNPIDITTTETATAGQYQGFYLNKQEVDQFRGPLPIEQYPLNDDPCPEVIKKRLDKVRYTQECGVKYLNPPPAPKPGDIIIRERQNVIPPAPPLIVK
jgi:hypothetical protein